MSDLPRGWEWTTLDNVAHWGSGGTPRAGSPEYYGGQIPWAVIGDLNDEIVRSTTNSLTHRGLDESSAKLIPSGTLLIAMYGSIGKLGIAGQEMATNQAIAFAKTKDNIETRYLFWYLRSQRESLQHAGKGATQQNISQTILKSWPIPLAPIAEQRRIVSILEDHFSRLDHAALATRQASDRTSVLYNSTLATLLNKTRYEEIPLGKLLRDPLINGRSVPTQDGGFPVLRLTALQDDTVDLQARKEGAWTEADATPYLIERDDFLVSRGNGSLKLVGRGGLVTANPDRIAFPDTMIRIRVDTSRIMLKYLSLLWNSQKVRAQVESEARTTAGIYKINQQILQKIRLPLPEIEDQKHVVESMENVRALINRTRTVASKALLQQQSLRRSLLTDAFAGRLTLTNLGSESTRKRLGQLKADENTRELPVQESLL